METVGTDPLGLCCVVLCCVVLCCVVLCCVVLCCVVLCCVVLCCVVLHSQRLHLPTCSQGRRFPLEAHFVHYNPAYGPSVSRAVASGQKDALLVIAVMFELGQPQGQDAALTAIANGVHGAMKVRASAGSCSVAMETGLAHQRRIEHSNPPWEGGY